MTLKEVRTQFINLSGRFDLVVDTINYVDNGANFFINSGIKYIESLPEAPVREQTFAISAEAGDYQAVVPNLRSIKRLWTYAPDGGVIFLERETLEGMLERLDDEVSLAEVAQDLPAFFALDERQSKLDENTVWGAMVLFMPPFNASYTLQVDGIFYSAELADDLESNYWTSQHPDLVVLGAMFQLETYHRNRQGSADYRAAISERLQNIDFGRVHEEVGDTTAMRGAW